MATAHLRSEFLPFMTTGLSAQTLSIPVEPYLYMQYLFSCSQVSPEQALWTDVRVSGLITALSGPCMYLRQRRSTKPEKFT